MEFSGSVASYKQITSSTENADDTVFQLSTGFGHGGTAVGVAIIRLSGKHALSALLTLTRRTSTPTPRMMVHHDIYHPITREVLDSGCLCVYFRAPNSFTGEDVVELHVHGNSVVVKGILAALPSCHKTSDGDDGVLRLAEAGEFTRRAFLNGKLDLTQVEGLADLLNAETERQKAQAVRQMKGELGVLYGAWRKELISCLAHCEAVIDFAEDEADVGEEEIMNGVKPRVTALRTTIAAHLKDGRRGEILRRGVVIAIAGSPNAGKSTLLNRLAGRDAAIVSSVPGTTRDVVEVPMNLHGFPVLMADTAGMRNTDDEVEKEGVRRAGERIATSDLKLALFDVMDLRDHLPSISSAAPTPTPLANLEVIDCDTIVVVSKVDLLSSSPEELDKIIAQARCFFNALPTPPAAVCMISCEEGHHGIGSLLDITKDEISRRLDNKGSDGAVITRQRHRQHLKECLAFIEDFDAHNSSGDLVLAAEQLRLSARELGKIVGTIDVEDILDVMFNDFCIGK